MACQKKNIISNFIFGDIGRRGTWSLGHGHVRGFETKN